jgi:hypothetical protein
VFGSGGSSDITSRINVIPGDTSGLRVYDRAQKEVDDLTRSTKAATGAADKLGDSLSKAARGADFGRTGGGLERVLGGTLGGGSQELLGIVGDIGDVIEGLAAEPGGLKGALKGLLSPAGLLSGALALGGVAMAAFTAEIDRQRASAQKATLELIDAAQAEAIYLQLLEKSGTAALENAKKEEQARFEIEAAVVSSLAVRKKALEEEVNAQRARGTYLTQEQADLDDVNAQYKKHQDALSGINDKVLILNEIMDGTEFAAARAAEGFEKLSDFLNVGKGAAESLGELVSGTLENIADMAQETADAADKAFTDLQTSVQSAVDKLDADGSKLGADLQKSMAALGKEATDAQLNAAEEIAELQIQSAQDRLAAESEFFKESDRAFQAFRTSQRRIREDADRAELGAIEANDIKSLLEISETAKITRQRNREDFDAQRQQRKQDFADRQQAETAALELTIASINQRRDEEIASINAEIVAERAAFDASIAEINRLKDANIAQIEAVVAANERKHAAEIAAVDTLTRKYEALVLYQNGKLYQLNPGLMNSPAAPGLLPIPPAPDPFGLGQFFNGSSLPPPRDSSQSIGPSAAPASSTPTVVFNEGAIVVGDIASKEDVKAAIIEGVIRPMAQARGVAA